MTKKLYRKIAAVLIAAALPFAILVAMPHKAADANSAYIPPNNNFGVSADGDGADIDVTAELLTFDFLSTDSPYRAVVTAEYTMNSPAEKTVTLGFPLVSTLAAVTENSEIRMNGKSVACDGYYFIDNHGYFSGQSEIGREFSTMSFDEQMAATVSKSYESEQADQDGWLYKIDDSFYGIISAAVSNTLVLYGNVSSYSRPTAGQIALLVSGGGYVFSYDGALNFTGIDVDAYSEEALPLGEFQRRIFPTGFYAEACYLFDSYCEIYGNAEIISITDMLSNFMNKNSSLMLVYRAPFLAGENKMTVSYGVRAYTNSSYTPATANFYYYTNPAKCWNNFSNLTVRIDTYDYVTGSSLKLKHSTEEKTVEGYGGSTYTREYNRYEFKSTALPDGNIRFTTCASKNPTSRYAYLPIYYLLPVIIVVAVVIIIGLTVALILVSRRKRRPAPAVEPESELFDK